MHPSEVTSDRIQGRYEKCVRPTLKICCWCEYYVNFPQRWYLTGGLNLTKSALGNPQKSPMGIPPSWFRWQTKCAMWWLFLGLHSSGWTLVCQWISKNNQPWFLQDLIVDYTYYGLTAYCSILCSCCKCLNIRQEIHVGAGVRSDEAKLVFSCHS